MSIDGILQMNARGFGFIVTGDTAMGDVYIAREDLNGAIHLDKVRAEVRTRKGRLEGVIKTILERNVVNVVGTLMKSKAGAFVIPDDARFGNHLDISDKCQVAGGKDLVGKKVVARFTECQKTVELVEVLGDGDKVGVDILSIIRAHNLYQEFPKEVERESEQVAKKSIADEIARREDLRKLDTITIDPSDAKDLDDAVSLTRDIAQGTWELGIHIADVSHYVTEGSALDTEAYERGTSVYFPNMVLPMLPKPLSNDVCSLHSGVDRLAVSVLVTLDKDGAIISHKIVESVINVKQRFAYHEVQEILDNKVKNKKYEAMLSELAALTLLVEKTRRARGEVVFDVPEPRIVLCQKTGRIKDVVAYPHHLSHRIIETCMILCNEVIAEKMCNLEVPFIYRVHEKPDPRKVAEFIEHLKPFGVAHRITPDNATGYAYQNMLDGLSKGEKCELKPIISQLALRSMQKAKYSPQNVGHFGLGAKFYCHFTSPIRRYPDLVIHRILKGLINRKFSTHKLGELRHFVKEAAEQSSRREVAATEAEREVDNLKRAEFMQDKIGEMFTGTISGIRDFGVFVYLPNTVEGLVRIENMPRDNYYFNEKQMTMVGRTRTYKMGDKLDVLVAGVNMARRQVEFACVQEA